MTKNFFSLFSSGPTLVVFKLRAGRAGLRQSSSHSLHSGAVSALKMDTVHWILVQPQTLYNFVVPNTAGTEERVLFGELWHCWRNALVVRLL